MFKYLENLFGKPMKFYETLMANKIEKAIITESQINKVMQALQPYLLSVQIINTEREEFTNYPFEKYESVPKNKKGIELNHLGTYLLDRIYLSLFVDKSKRLNDVTIKTNKIDIDKEIKLKQHLMNTGKSLPIWEEVIHRFPEVHKLIVSLNNKHPWTLYKETIKRFNLNKGLVKIGGYPQWKVNNVDFRTLDGLLFLMEYQSKKNDFSIYFFENSITKEVIMIKQNG